MGNSVTSPQYPQSYPANANCKWLLRDRLALLKDEIMTKPTSLVLIALQLADSIYDCNKDFIEIYTDTNELQGRFVDVHEETPG